MMSDNAVLVSYSYVPAGAYSSPVSGFAATTEIVSFGSADTWKTVFEKAKEDIERRGHFIIGDLMADSLHQPDSNQLTGESRLFDRLSAQSLDWSKLPDWPAWSRLMADQPL